MSTDKGESGEKGWIDDLADVGSEGAPAVAPDDTVLGSRPGLRMPDGQRRRADAWAPDVGDRSWYRLAWSLVALLTVTVVLGLTCAVWLTDRAFSQLNQTERNVANLVTSAQASSQAFAVSQDDARSAYVSSQIALNQSEAQKNREQVKLDRSLIALAQAQAATQRADAQLAYAEAALDEARAQASPSAGAG